MAKPAWKKFPHADKAFVYAGAALKKNWERLHSGDCEPFPADAAVQEAWRLYHQGEFGKAFEAGLAAGVDGYNAANKAAMIYATYLEDDDQRKLELFQSISARCEELQQAQPKNANAWYFQAYALGRYSQGISVLNALTQGLGGRIKAALDAALKLAPKHAEAHTALGAYHAEVVDKVGALIGKLTYGANRESAVKHFETALKLVPDSAIARIEYANALVMLFGQGKMDQAVKLYEKAAAETPVEAMECLDVELAKAELED
ncbi:MAG: tetratricopeptide repeat protein [Sulfuritalea sp.]|jgi:tetratricopeptide (TPR) repeat protein|nr:tetratricopeptide repeat protein [Sulfuritalea sp.]